MFWSFTNNYFNGLNNFTSTYPLPNEHTNFHRFKKGTKVNLEFDLIGKYIQRLRQLDHE